MGFFLIIQVIKVLKNCHMYGKIGCESSYPAFCHDIEPYVLPVEIRN